MNWSAREELVGEKGTGRRNRYRSAKDGPVDGTGPRIRNVSVSEERIGRTARERVSRVAVLLYDAGIRARFSFLPANRRYEPR
jgi:hypothetical protein